MAIKIGQIPYGRGRVTLANEIKAMKRKSNWLETHQRNKNIG
jgi:hypothetical protein